MATFEIKSYTDVILFEMQRCNMGEMSFSEAWRICERANDCLLRPTNMTDKKLFAWRLIEALKILQTDGYIALRHDRSGERIKMFTLTERGAERLGKDIFTQLDRMGDRP